MSLIPWKKGESGARRLSTLQQQFNSLFEDFFSEFPDLPSLGRTTFPPLTVSDTDKVVNVTAELPGMTPEDVEIKVDGGVLTLKGEKKEERREEKENFFRLERSFGSFLRQVTLPAEVDAERAEATMDKGVLKLRFPKVEGKSAKTISVKSG